MNTQVIHYYFWMNSDWAYLGADRLQDIAQRHGIQILYRPVDLPDVYRRTGGVLLHQRAPERQAYRVIELKRWCRKLGIPLNPQPKHMCPDAELASCVVIAADQSGVGSDSVAALYKAILAAEWVHERDISQATTLHEILSAQRLDVDVLLAQAATAQIQNLYRQYTNEAVATGVFGSPAYVFNGELFWGQDRLDMLEDAVSAAARRYATNGTAQAS